jgi:DNA repair exonuclease SbcCD ATPase subunit
VEAKYKVPIEQHKDTKKIRQDQIVSMESQIKTIVSIKPAITLEEVAKQQAESEAYKKQLLEKEQTKNPYADILNSLNEKQKALKENTDKSYKELKEVEKLIPYYEYLLSVFGKEGIKSFVIDQIVPTLNQQVEYWMQILYQGAIKVTFDKLLNVTLVNNASQNEMVFGQGSGGERRRIDLAVMLAFRQVMKLSTNKDPNIVFFDEPAENLDEEGALRFFDVLQDMAKDSKVYVITHNVTLLEQLRNCNTILIEKQNGVAVLK